MHKHRWRAFSVRPLLKTISRVALSAARTLTVRAYALLILLIVVWTGYTAVAYLVRTVFTPVHVPDRFMSRKSTAGLDPLKSAQRLTAAIQPLPGDPGHYHQAGRWPETISQEGCATSGCHNQLPHTRHKETRAFANFHVTFLTCGMCHDARLQNPVAAAWVDSAGERSGPPALLQLMRLLELEADRIKQSPGEVHSDIIKGLRSTLKATGGDPLLEYLLIQLDTSEPGSPVWRQAFARLNQELPNHTRGEYGARIAPESLDAERRQREEKLHDQAARVLSAPADSPQRDALKKEIHTDVLAKPEACLSCHSGEPARLDFESLGYSPQRAAALRGTPIARMIQQMRDGRPFHLPQLLEERK